jgi:HPt (histidine-containing phosphotransfer) domain-containing protein|tara:strand:- start:374 stop:682 length:309 start_codon:yes stop_codon:yes gene_type:complete
MEEKKIVVKVDADLEDLVPDYLENRDKDIKSISESLEKGDFENVRIIGHSMKGSGGGYGFDRISEIGKTIEDSAKEKNLNEIKKGVEQLSHYLQNVEVVYEE